MSQPDVHDEVLRQLAEMEGTPIGGEFGETTQMAEGDDVSVDDVVGTISSQLPPGTTVCAVSQLQAKDESYRILSQQYAQLLEEFRSLKEASVAANLNLNLKRKADDPASLPNSPSEEEEGDENEYVEVQRRRRSARVRSMRMATQRLGEDADSNSLEDEDGNVSKKGRRAKQVKTLQMPKTVKQKGKTVHIVAQQIIPPPKQVQINPKQNDGKGHFVAEARGSNPFAIQGSGGAGPAGSSTPKKEEKKLVPPEEVSFPILSSLLAPQPQSQRQTENNVTGRLKDTSSSIPVPRRQQTNNTSKREYVPPIMIVDTVAYKAFRDTVISVLGHRNFTVSVQRGMYSLKLYTLADREAILAKLKTSDVQHFTHSVSAERRKLYVLRTVPGLSADDVKEEIVARHTVEDVSVSALKPRGGNLDAARSFLVAMPRLTNMAEVKNDVSDVMNGKAYWRPFQKSRRAVQCFRCQGFGHGSSGCGMRPRCVICSEEHDAKSCPYDRNSNEHLRCCNCGGRHPANYSGCEARIKYEEEMAAVRERFRPVARTARAFTSRPVQEGVRFADAMRGVVPAASASNAPIVLHSGRYNSEFPSLPGAPSSSQPVAVKMPVSNISAQNALQNAPSNQLPTSSSSRVEFLVRAIQESNELESMQKEQLIIAAKRLMGFKERNLKIAFLGLIMDCLDD